MLSESYEWAKGSRNSVAKKETFIPSLIRPASRNKLEPEAKVSANSSFSISPMTQGLAPKVIAKNPGSSEQGPN